MKIHLNFLYFFYKGLEPFECRQGDFFECRQGYFVRFAHSQQPMHFYIHIFELYMCLSLLLARQADLIISTMQLIVYTV